MQPEDFGTVKSCASTSFISASQNQNSASQPCSVTSSSHVPSEPEYFGSDFIAKTSKNEICNTAAVNQTLPQICTYLGHANQNTVSLTSYATPSISTNVTSVTFSSSHTSSNVETPFCYSTPQCWSKNDSEISDPIQFLMQPQEAKNSSNIPYQMSLNPPLPQRLSSLQNPLPFQVPSYYNNSMPYATFPFTPDFSYPLNYYDYPDCYGYDATPATTNYNMQSWNELTFPNSVQTSNVYQTSQHGENDLQSYYPQMQNDNLYEPSAISNDRLAGKRSNKGKNLDTGTSLWLYILRGVSGSGKSTLAGKLKSKYNQDII